MHNNGIGLQATCAAKLAIENYYRRPVLQGLTNDFGVS